MKLLRRVLRKRRLRRIRRAADEWAQRLISLDPNDWDHVQFKRWLCANPLHATEFNRSLQIWQRLCEANTEVRPSVSRTASRPSSHRLVLLRPVLAATVVVAAIVAVVVFWPIGSTEIIATRTAEQRLVRLPDGSTVLLNTRTQLQLNSDSRNRGARLLTGEALFTVRRDPTRPFVVSVEGIDVRVLGTVFDVYRHKDGRVVVIVLDGTVAVSSTGRGIGQVPWSQELHANQGIEARNGTVLSGAHYVSATDAVAWREGRFEAEGPLPLVVEELARYTDIPIKLRDPRLAKVQVVATLGLTDIAATLYRIQAKQPVIVERVGNFFEIRCRQNCSETEASTQGEGQ